MLSDDDEDRMTCAWETVIEELAKKGEDRRGSS